MGRSYNFRLSDMIPRAWFRSLKRPGSALLPAPNEPPPRPPLPLDHPHQRKSYHFSRQLGAVHPLSPPKRSATGKHRRSAHLGRPTRPRRVTASVSAGCSCRTLADFDHRTKPECRFPVSPSSSPSSTGAVFPPSPPSSESFDGMVSLTTAGSSCRCVADSDVVLDHNPLFELELPAVIAKPPEFNEMVMNLRRRGENRKPIATNRREDPGSSLDTYKEKKKPRPIVYSASSTAGGMRVRVNSPKLATRKINRARLQGSQKNPGSKAGKGSSVSDGFAVVKTSEDPRKDFRESMVEMIVENEIRASKDLEELLARYLMLNSDEYHDLIVGVFKQIWFDLYRGRSK